MRILILGGGFGGVATARHLERLMRGRTNVEITLISRENFFIITPLLFEACSGRLELRHCAQPIRAALRRARFIEATVQRVDVERRIVLDRPEAGRHVGRHLVLGGDDQDGIDQWGEIDEDDPIDVSRHQRRGDCDGQPRLADAAGTSDGK